MSKAKEEEQLLEDASTLLMFANAAARQRSPGSPQLSELSRRSQSPPILNRHSEDASTGIKHIFSPSNVAEDNRNLASTEDSSLQVLKPPFQATHHSAPQLPVSRKGPALGPSQPNQLPLKLPQQQGPVVFSSLQSYAVPLPNLSSKSSSSPPTSSSTPNPVPAALPTRTYGYYQYGYNTQPAYASPEIAPKPRQYAPLSPKPPQNLGDSTQKLNLLPRQSGLPPQGSFQNTHKRTVSEGSQLRKPLSSFSPGPVFARGIDVESRARSSDNAVIAAAALAEAADHPLPLKNKRENAKEAPALLAIKQEFAAKSDDSASTEPEDDKTDDELPLIAPSTSVDVNMSSATILTVASVVTVQKNNEPETVSHPSGPPELDSYKVDPDAGTIGCICGIEEDDGFTIQCDVCFRWQHCSCMGYKTNDEVPEDEYTCYFCDQAKWGKFDPNVCRSDTLIRLDLEQVEQEKPAPKRKTSSSSHDDKKRRKSEKDVKPPSEDKPVNDKRKSINSASSASPTTVSTTSPPFQVNNKDNPLLDDGVTAEVYQSVYFRLHENDFKTPTVRKTLGILGQSIESSSGLSNTTIETMPLAQFKQIKMAKVISPNYQKYLRDKNEIKRSKSSSKVTIEVKAYSENPKQKFVGVSKIGLFISDASAQQGNDFVIPPGTPIIEYLGEIDSFKLYASNRVNQYSTWGAVKPRVVKVDLTPSTEEISSPIVIDSRFVGNEARFIRKSCPPSANCEIRPIYVPQLKQFKFVVFTTSPIVLKGESLDEELRLKWEWDDFHPITKMLIKNDNGLFEEGRKFEDYSEDERMLLVSGVDTILNFVECACNTTNSNHLCSIFKVKKATSYLLRSTRKASSLNNNSISKSKEELVMPKKDKQFISWKERLVERDNILHQTIFSVGQTDESDGNSADERPQTDKPDTTVLKRVDITVKTGVEKGNATKIPFRRQLMAQGRRFAARKFNWDPTGLTDIKLDATIKESVSQNASIPLTPNILNMIKDSVDKVFKPLTKSVLETEADEELESKDIVTDVEQVLKEKSPTVSGAKAELVATTESKPPVVKKLSFADYKKKMK